MYPREGWVMESSPLYRVSFRAVRCVCLCCPSHKALDPVLREGGGGDVEPGDWRVPEDPHGREHGRRVRQQGRVYLERRCEQALRTNSARLGGAISIFHAVITSIIAMALLWKRVNSSTP